MHNVVVLGSTGSIGTQTLEVARRHPDRIRIVGLAAHSRSDLIVQQAAEFGADACLYDEAAARSAGIPGGMQAILDMVTGPSVDTVVVSVAGVIGLEPTIAAIRAGKKIALASKEVLVAAGELVMPLLREHEVPMLPIDSEHSAIFQSLNGYQGASQDLELILTASGGPFRGWTREQLAEVTVEMALNHPTWRMGGKITIDSATMMNKGLEVIEAHWLFGVPLNQVRVVVHPQSIIHSMVRYPDGSVIGQMGAPDMMLPIQVALFHPERPAERYRDWDPVTGPSLTFESVDEGVFRCLALAREASRMGGTMPCVMNAANEAAVARFLNGEIGFLDIDEIVRFVMESHVPGTVNLESLLETDQWARRQVAEFSKR